MTTKPLGYSIGVWIALEDILNDAGPLTYFPESHRLPYILTRDFNERFPRLRNYTVGEHIGRTYDWSTYNSTYVPFIKDQIKDYRLKEETFIAQKGDVLVYHTNLLHGGSRVYNPERTRWSVVFHYFAKDVIAYRDLFKSKIR